MLGGMLLLVAACGYRFSGEGALPGGALRLSLGILENRSSETGVEGIFLNAVGAELTRHGKTFSYGDGADASLSGTILSISARPITRQSVHVTIEREVTVVLSLKLSKKTGEVLWEETRLTDREAYAVVDNHAATEQNKRAALEKIAERLAERVYYGLTDKF